MTDGTTMFVAEGTDVVDVIDGRERWRVPAETGPIDGIRLVGRDIVGAGATDNRQAPAVMTYLALDPEPHLVGTMPDHIDAHRVYPYDVGGDAVVLARVDQTPGSDGSDESDDLVAVALTANGARITATTQVPAYAFMNAYPLKAQLLLEYDGTLRAVSVPDLASAGTFHLASSSVNLGPAGALAVADGGVTLYR